MKIVGNMAARSEAWILNLSIRAALEFCDELVILNHMPDDETGDLLHALPAELKRRVVVIVENDPKWDEMRHRQTMIDRAREMGATHVAIVDSDEVASVPLRKNLRAIAEQLSPGEIAAVPMVNLRHGWNYHSGTGIWSNRQVSVVWRDDPALSYEGDKFHSREPLGSIIRTFMNETPVAHFWGWEERRLVAKHALYKCAEVIRWPNKPIADIDNMYSWSVKGPSWSPAASWTFAPVPEAWIPRVQRQLLKAGQTPYQEQCVRDMVAEHGAAKFAGLDLFGVDA
jgi:hypothetical protein